MATKKNIKRRTGDGFMASVGKITPSKPEFGITERELPEIKGWKVGDKYEIGLTVKMVSMSEDSDYDTPMPEGGGERKKIMRATTDSNPRERNLPRSCGIMQKPQG